MVERITCVEKVVTEVHYRGVCAVSYSVIKFSLCCNIDERHFVYWSNTGDRLSGCYLIISYFSPLIGFLKYKSSYIKMNKRIKYIIDVSIQIFMTVAKNAWMIVRHKICETYLFESNRTEKGESSHSAIVIELKCPFLLLFRVCNWWKRFRLGPEG